ncbi:MAG TPA: hypothetical protein VFZ04_08335 [Longimicrobiales bacterium]
MAAGRYYLAWSHSGVHCARIDMRDLHIFIRLGRALAARGIARTDEVH